MKRFLLYAMALMSLSVFAKREELSGDIVYRRAQLSDIPGILSLMEESAKEADKLVVLPQRCREPFLKDIITKKQLFVAVANGEIVGTKKLFVMEGSEKEDILQNLIRATGRQSKLTYSGTVDAQGLFLAHEAMEAPGVKAFGVCIYDGFDFTRKDYRGKGVNNGLFQKGFELIAGDVRNALRANEQEQSVSLVYGLTHANAGEKPGLAPDRTIGMAKSFSSFMQKFFTNESNSLELFHYRYTSAMPVFDQASKDCKPLSEDLWIQGFGCILTYAFTKKSL